MSKLVTTFFYVGRLSRAPEILASFAAIFSGYLIHVTGGFPLLAATTVIVFIIGWIAINTETSNNKDYDPREIVIYVVVGQWLTLLPISFFMDMMEVDKWFFPYHIYTFVLLAFLILQAWKPGPIGMVNRMAAPLGQTLVSIAAGVMVLILELTFVLVVYVVVSNMTLNIIQ